MEIRVIIEPDYRNSFWCMETVSGLSNQAYQRKIRLTEMNEDTLSQLNGPKSGEVIAVIGTSINWINRIASVIQEKKLLSLLVTGDQDTQSVKRTNSILLDYQSSMQALLSYLQETGDEKIALFGVNPSSYADAIKKDAFPWKESVYYNFGSILTSTQQLWNNIDSFTAVICVNDMVAVHLLHFLQERGVRVPEQIRLLSFGDSFLSKLMQPSITSVEQDFRLLGAQAVKVCTFLEKNPQLIINAFIRCPLRIRKSTGSVRNISQELKWKPPVPHVNFYIDESIAQLQALDSLLSESDDLDIQILELLMRRETQEHIAEQLNLALSSLRYRIRKMCACFPDSSRSKMLETIRLYLPANALREAELIKKNP